MKRMKKGIAFLLCLAMLLPVSVFVKGAEKPRTPVPFTVFEGTDNADYNFPQWSGVGKGTGAEIAEAPEAKKSSGAGDLPKTKALNSRSAAVDYGVTKVDGKLPAETGEISFDLYIDTCPWKGIYISFGYDDGKSVTPHSTVVFFRPAGDSKYKEYGDAIAVAYTGKNVPLTAPSYHANYTPVPKKDMENSAYLKMDRWYSVKIQITPGQKTAELYIDGYKIADIPAEKSVRVINSIRVQKMSGGDGANNIFVDNIALREKAGAEPYYFEDFEDYSLGAVSASVWDKQKHNALTVSEVWAKTDGDEIEDWETVPASDALRIWQNGTAMAQAHRYFLPTDKMSVSFDYMGTKVTGISGAYIALLSGEDRKFDIRIRKVTADDAYPMLRNYTGKTFVDITELLPGVWYNIKIDFTGTGAKLYLNGELTAELADIDPGLKTVDRIVFGTASRSKADDEYFIDNLTFTGAYETEMKAMTDPFADSFDGETEDWSFTGEGSHTLSDGKLSLAGSIEAVRTLPAKSMAGKFGFTLESDTPSGIQLEILCGKTAAVVLKIGDNGALYYKRDNLWTICTDPGVIKAGEKTEISLDLPDGRNADYFNVRVNGELAGTALYYQPFLYVDAVRITVPEGGQAAIVDLYGIKSDGVIPTPQRGEAAAPAVYLPEIIENAKVMYLAKDTDPRTGSIAYAADGKSFTFDSSRNSIGVDLGTVQRVNAIRITGNKETARGFTQDNISVWQSNDNKTWKELYGHTLNFYKENGVSAVLIEFSGVTARYVKVNYSKTDAPASITADDLTASVRAERKIARQWALAGTPMYKKDDTAPDAGAMAFEVNAKTADGKDKNFLFCEGDSIGVSFGIHSHVEAVEITAKGLSGLSTDAFALYYSLDNCDYSPITDVILSRDQREGRDVYRLTFDSVKCGYLKLHNISGGEITLVNLYDGLAAYSSVECVTNTHTYTGARAGDGGFYTREDGTLVMSFVGFDDGGGDFDAAPTLSIQSIDGGYTWSDSWIELQTHETGLNVGCSSYIRLENGDLGVIYLEKDLNVPEKNNRNICNIYIRRSHDNGRTWSSPLCISKEFDAYTIQASGMRYTRLSTGRILVPVNYSVYTDDAFGSDRSIAFVLYSDDDGGSWNLSNAVTLPNAALEPIAAEMENGMVLMTLRTRKEGKIYQSVSADGGETWSQPHALSEIVTPSSTNVVVRIPQTKDVLLVWNNEFATNNGKRDPLAMAVSADNGVSYGNIRNLIEGSGAWAAVQFYGRSVYVQSNAKILILDVADLYHPVSGVKTVADLPKADTPEAEYKDGWLTGVSADMIYSLDGGETWKFCGGTSVYLGGYSGRILVKNIGTHGTAPSEIQKLG